MNRAINDHAIIGLEQQASPAAVRHAYGHWRTLLRPLLEEEAALELNPNMRWKRGLAMVRVEEAYERLLHNRRRAGRVH